MSEKKNTLNIIDETIDAVKNVTQSFDQITDALNSAKEELITLEEEKNKLRKEKTLLEGEKSQLQVEKKGLEIATRKLTESKKDLEAETEQLEKDKQERDEKIGALTGEQVRLLDEYEKLKVELNKFASAAEEAEDSEFNFERIKALLSIYAVLIEKIFQGQPHYRIYHLLHGLKSEMTRDEIKNATGIGGAFVLRAIHELNNAELIEYDEEKSLVRLKRRLFEPEALDEN